MELIYFWIGKDFENPQNGLGYKFTSEFSFEIEISERKDSKVIIELLLTPNDKFIPNFFGSDLMLIQDGKKDMAPLAQVKSVTGIIGKNGVGKTTLMHDVIDLLTDKLILEETYFVLYRQNDKLKLLYSDDLSIDLRNESTYEIEMMHEKMDTTFEGYSILRTNKIRLNKDQIVYYNPALDFRNIPINMSREGKGYIDVSTNALIMDDQIEPGIKNKKYDRNDREYNPVINHKIASIRRSIDLTFYNFNLPEIYALNIPREYKVSCQEFYFSEEGDQKNVQHDALEILQMIKGLVNTVYSETNKDIDSVINILYNDSIPTDSQDYEKADEVFQNAMRKKVLAEFINSLTNTFFDNLHDEYMYDIGVKNEDIFSNDLYQYARSFFAKQNFAESLDLLIDSIKRCIDLTTYNDPKEYDYFILSDPIEVITLLSNYSSYLSGFKKQSSSVRTCLNFDWRDISTGEKMKLDLYGRLLFASKDISRETKDIFIFIDEGELGFHPEWKKKYLDDLLKFLSVCFIGKSIQLILTTHSPFLISDLPSANTILLDKVEGGIIKILETEELDLFGANIYDLYRNSFFIEDNTYIGQFARRKIDEVLHYIHKEEYNVDAHEKNFKITNLIGDQVIKSKLLELLSTKMPPQKEGASDLDKLKKQREILDSMIKKMEDDLGKSK